MKIIIIITLAIFASLTANSQTFINGNFENSTIGWINCAYEHGAEYVYGGTNPFNHVMVVHGGPSNRITDDILLCQTISGFEIGKAYTFSLDASNMPFCTPTVNPFGLWVSLSQGALNQRIELQAGQGYQTYFFNFVATDETLDFQVKPDFDGTCGAMVDNLEFLIVVPIELLSFNVKLNGRAAQITWETAQELNNDYFVVERTDNGFDWEDIGKIDAVGIAQFVNYYEIEDANFFRGVSYYRLKQFDKDGEIFYSETRALAWNYDFENTVLYPNPAQNQLFVQIKDAQLLEIAIFNSIGEQVPVSYKQQTDNIVIDTKWMEGGIYLLSLKRGEASYIKQFVVQH